MEHAVVINKMVLNNCVKLEDSVAKGDFGPSSSANSCTFQDEILVIADSALCKVAEKRNNVHQSIAP